MLERGHSIADYQIVKPLEENQVYQTCLVEHPEFDFAWMHLFSSAQFPDEKARQRFLSVATKLLGQSVSSACTLQEAEANSEYVYALYPVPPGQPLADRLETTFTTREALELIRQVAVILSEAHASNLWHGNLSPAAIYLEGDRLTLADFALNGLVQLDFNSGVDPCYSSPELVRGETLGPASDLYSLGIVLYRLLSGELPFRGAEPFAIAMQHLQGEIPLLPEELVICQPLLESMLQSLADERTSADELLENIDRLLAMPVLDEIQPPIQLLLEDMLQEATTTEAEPETIAPPAFEDEAEVEASEPVAEEVAVATPTEQPSTIEKVIIESDVAARIEERLKERAAALQLSSHGGGSERANSARMASISRGDGQVAKIMDPSRYQQKSVRGRFLLLTLLGIAIGAVLYLFLFTPMVKKTPPAAATGVPTELAAALEMGHLQIQRKDFDAAEKTFVGLIDRFPNLPHPYNNLAVVYASQGQLEDARTALEQALATDEGYATVYRNLGTVYAEMARDSYGRALQLKKGQHAVSLQMFAADGPLPLTLDKATDEPAVAAKIDTPQVAAVDTAPIKAEVAPVAPLPVEVPALAAEPVAAEPSPTVPEAVTEVVLEAEPEAAELFLHRWAEAWSAQNVESYLSFYADSFVPSSGQSRAEWEKNRQVRLKRPKKIEVSLDDFSMVRMQDDKMQMEVTQSYRSDRYADRTRKLFDLQRKGDNWEILRERSLGRVQ